MKICAICTGFASWYGGPEVVLSYLSREWVKKGHEVYILCGRGSKTMPSYVRVIKLPFISRTYFDKLPIFKKIPFFFPTFEFESASMFPFILPHLKKINPDLVLTITLPETLASLLLGYPTVMMSQAGSWYRLRIYNKVDLIIVNEPFSLIRLRKMNYKVKLILNGVELKDIAPSFLEKVRSKYSIPKDKIKILSIARLDDQKRIHLLIEAFKLIQENAILIIVGEGPELQRLREMCSPIQTKVIFLSKMPHEEILALYRLCDVFSLPSLGEAFGLVLIEALASGKPVVTNPEPVKEFLLGSYGIFVDVEDPRKYSQALLYAATHQIDTCSNKFREYISKFSWEKIAEEYIDVFKNIINCRNATR